MKTKYASNAEAFRASARLARNLGDEDIARRWERQADMEERYEQLTEHLDYLRTMLNLEVDLRGSRTEMAKSLRLSIIATEKELEQIGKES